MTKQHLWLPEEPAVDRELPEGIDVVATCHWQAGGPFGGLAAVMQHLLPQMLRQTPELVADHRDEILYLFPELTQQLGPARPSLVSTTEHAERTRYFGNGYIRGMAQSLVTLLINFSAATQPLTLCFRQLDAADFSEQEFLAILLRRAQPQTLRVILTGLPEVIPDLTEAISRYAKADLTSAGGKVNESNKSVLELARLFIESDGRIRYPQVIAAYLSSPVKFREELHDARAEFLSVKPSRGQLIGPIPFHRERGSDPGGAGRRALREALELCVAIGYSRATVELGLRGRQVTDPDEYQEDYCHFTAKAASAYIPLGELGKSHELYQEMLDRYPEVLKVQMNTRYAIAMLHTRFFEPRDHTAALQLVNEARALAKKEADPVERIYFEVFHDNGLSLVEMHRGNLELALKLVTDGLTRVELELPSDRYIVHRTQLRHNRARLLAAMRRFEEAEGEFTKLIALDPAHVEYHVDRANIYRRQGKLGQALRDYDRAVEVSAPFSELFFNRADLRAELGDFAGALADLRYAVDLDPKFVEATINLGSLLLDSDPGQAARVLQAGLEYSPKKAEVHYLLGLALEAEGDIRGAGLAYDNAISCDQECAGALVARAGIRQNLGNLVGARGDLEQAAKCVTDPEDQAAIKYNLELLISGAA